MFFNHNKTCPKICIESSNYWVFSYFPTKHVLRVLIRSAYIQLGSEIFCLIEVFQPSQPITFMAGWSVYQVILFLGRHSPLMDKPVLVYILLPQADNCPSWICRRKKMTKKIFHDQSSQRNVAEPSEHQTQDLLITTQMIHWKWPARIWTYISISCVLNIQWGWTDG